MMLQNCRYICIYLVLSLLKLSDAWPGNCRGRPALGLFCLQGHGEDGSLQTRQRRSQSLAQMLNIQKDFLELLDFGSWPPFIFQQEIP